MKIHNRRYTGSKYKLMPYIKELIKRYCLNCTSFFDVFAGTGIITASVIDMYDKFIVNDFLYSNEIIYKAFFSKESFNPVKLESIVKEYNNTDRIKLPHNYMSLNYGNKFFRMEDAKLIGHIREDISNKNIN